MGLAKPTLLTMESRFRAEKKFVVQIRQNCESLVHFLARITQHTVLEVNFLVHVDYASLHADIGLIFDAVYSYFDIFATLEQLAFIG